MRRVKCELSEKEKAVSFDLGQISLKAIFKYLIILVDLPLPSNGKKKVLIQFSDILIYFFNSIRSPLTLSAMKRFLSFLKLLSNCKNYWISAYFP